MSLLFEKEGDKILTAEERNELAKELCTFLMKHYGDYPPSDVKRSAAIILSSFFSCLTPVSILTKYTLFFISTTLLLFKRTPYLTQETVDSLVQNSSTIDKEIIIKLRLKDQMKLQPPLSMELRRKSRERQ